MLVRVQDKGRLAPLTAGCFSIPDALAELRRHGVLAADVTDWTPLQVNGEKAVVALGRGAGRKLVVKIDRPNLVWAAAWFLETYRGVPLVPILWYLDAAHRFLACDYVLGETGRRLEASAQRVDKAQTLLALAHGLISRYVPTNAGAGAWLHAQYGRRHAPDDRTTWQHFLAREVASRRNPLCAYLPDMAHTLVRRLTAAARRRGAGPLHLLHGDCGAHNLMYRDGQLAAVIDPLPVAGEPIFDLAFAFVSWPGDLTLDTIMPAADVLARTGRWQPAPRERLRVLVEEVLIALYVRMGTFAVWRQADVPTYLEAWTYWTDWLRQT
jgi:aminoglycoside phosphotransferase (APT) family kinase protein